MQAVPGGDVDGAEARVMHGKLRIGFAPAGGAGALEPGAVASWPADTAGGRRDGVGVKHSVGAGATQQACPGVRQSGAQRDGVA